MIIVHQYRGYAVMRFPDSPEYHLYDRHGIALPFYVEDMDGVETYVDSLLKPEEA